MSRSGEYLAHPLHATLRDVRGTLAAVSAEDREAIEELGPGGVLARTLVVVDTLEGLLAVLDPDLVSIGVLDRVNSHVAPLRQTISSPPMDDESWDRQRP